MITSPADHRLIIDPASPDQVIRGQLRIAAKVWGISATSRVHASIDSGPDFPLARDGRATSLWTAVSNDALADGRHELTVRVLEQTGEADSETIVFVVSRDGTYEMSPRTCDGSDQDAVGAWPEKHLLGTRLGPNRNGRKW
jgi:hypothetical protein